MTHLHCLCAITLAFGQCGLALAGEPAAPVGKVEIPAIPVDEDAWQFSISPYGWLVNLEGTMGIRGFTTPLDLSVSDILSNLNMAAMLGAEARKGRWGAWLDFGYLEMSVGDNPSDGLFDTVGLTMEQVLVEGTVFYRVLDGERGYLDLYGGARYFYIGGKLELGVSPEGVRDVSENLSQRMVDQLLAAVSTKAGPAVAGAASQRAEQLADDLQSDLAENISQKVSGAHDKLDDLREIAAAYPGLVDKLRNSEALKDAITDAASARLEAKRIEMEQKATDLALLTDELRAAANRAKAKAEKAVSKAEKKLARKLEDALNQGIPSEISGSQSWVDPFIGMRARYNFTDRWYAIAKADIGGFGVGSNLIWQAYGALGYHLTKSGNTTLELGYRHMAIDYESDEFLYDTTMSGAMIAIGFHF